MEKVNTHPKTVSTQILPTNDIYEPKNNGKPTRAVIADTTKVANREREFNPIFFREQVAFPQHGKYNSIPHVLGCFASFS